MDIEHELVVAAPIARVFHCFDTADGLSAWWTDSAVVDPVIGGTCRFGFDAEHQWSGVIRVYDPPHVIEWEMTDTAPMADWMGTRVGARLTAEGAHTRLHFHHRGWDGATAHHRISSFCWAMYLRLLARHCTTGEFIPYARRDDL